MIVHESRNSAFRRPFGAAETGTEVYLAAEKAGAPDMTLRLHPFTGEDTLLPMTAEGGGRFSVTVTLPETPCVLWYSFFTGDDETCAWQITVYNKAAVPDWWKDGVVYQIFPDRFARERGWTPREPETRRGTHRFLVRDWDTPVFYPRAENGDVSSWPFWGGTLRGIEEKLPYLASLGVTVLYLNPIFEAASNHRYDTADYARIDPLLGKKKDFESLCAAARKRGIRIVLDGVFSHTGADSVYFDKFGNYGTAEKYRSWFRFGAQYRHGYECWWDVPDLPNVEENDPSFREFLCGEDGVVRRWLRRGASGWRLDVADELPDEFIARIRRVMMEEKAESFLLGEVWEDGSNKIAYSKRRKYLLGRETHGLMNYPFRVSAMDYLRGGDAAAFKEAMETIRENYPRPAFYSCMNMLGTHDNPRILTLLGTFPKEAPHTRTERAHYRMSPEEYHRGCRLLQTGAIILYAFPGSPTIFYGDEAGMEGYEDPFNRGTFPWGHEDRMLQRRFALLGSLRNNRVSLQKGELRWLYAQGHGLAFARTLGDEITIAATNAGDEPVFMTFDWPGDLATDALTGQQFLTVKGKITICLPPLDGVLLV